MAGSSSKSNAPRTTRKRVDVETNSLKRARDGSAFARCEECKKDVPVVLIDMHSCSLDSKIKMNLEANVVEMVSETKKPAESKKRSSSSSSASKPSKKGKKSNSPNMPKRPLTAFFVFMEEFRKSFKEANPESKGIKTVAKEAGEKWKSLTEEEKKPYLDRAAELKAEYEKAVESLNAENEEDQEEENGEEQEEEDVEEEKNVEEHEEGTSEKEEEKNVEEHEEGTSEKEEEKNVEEHEEGTSEKEEE